MTTNIYILIDPKSEKVRYVGKANNVTQRYRAHLNRARKHQQHKKNWIDSLKKDGLKPIIEIIDVVPIDEWIFWETYWISQFKTWGFDLINYTNGGDGCTFSNQTSFKGDNAKKVVAYGVDYIKKYEFNSAIEATNYFKLNKSSIPCCCSNVCRNKTIKGYAWFYYNDVKNISESELNVLIRDRFFKIKSILNSGVFKRGQKGLRAKKVKLTNISTNAEFFFDSGKEAGKYISVTQPAVSWALKYNKLIKKIYKITLINEKL